MPTPTGQISFSQLQTEFGGVNPISLSEYYRGSGTGYVPGGQATSPQDGVPISTSGQVRLGMYRGQTKTVTINLAINSESVGTYNIFTQAGSPTGQVNVILTIAGIYLYAPNVSSWALDTGAGWHASSTITIYNNGAVVGRGGAGGGSIGAVGGAGGPAFRAQRAVTIYNYNLFGGGGGGGGASGGYATGKNLIAQGSGGGGASFGAGGAGNFSGASGTVAAPGAGGNGFDGGAAARGGNGGSFGAAGGTSPAYSYAGVAGGGAGSCTNGNGFITWAATGSRLGALN